MMLVRSTASMPIFADDLRQKIPCRRHHSFEKWLTTSTLEQLQWQSDFGDALPSTCTHSQHLALLKASSDKAVKLHYARCACKLGACSPILWRRGAHGHS